LALFRIDDNMINQDPRHLYILRLQSAIRRQTFDLGDHDSAVIVRRECLIQRTQICALVLHCEVAFFVGRCCPNNRHIGRDRLEKKPLFALEYDHLHQVSWCSLVHRTALTPRINECIQSDFG